MSPRERELKSQLVERDHLIQTVYNYCKARIEKNGEDALYPLQVLIEEHRKQWGTAHE